MNAFLMAHRLLQWLTFMALKVNELMSKPAVTCRETDSLKAVAARMWDRDCGAMPVVDEVDTVIGMITDRDLCMAVYAKDQRLSDRRVADVANGNVFSVGPQDTIAHAAKMMRDHQVRRLPVIDERDRLVGVLALSDIARKGERDRSQNKKSVGRDEVVHTLAAICEPTSRRARASG
jgi:CBS domain-containing protein